MMLFLEILISMSVGVCLGILSGLLPGIHVNLIATTLIALSPWLLKISTPLDIAVIIIATAMVQTFASIIPSIFLGAPENDKVIVLLPGHKLLKRGRGYEAVVISVVGSLITLILTMAAIPLIGLFIKEGYQWIEGVIGEIILVACIFLLCKERKSKKWAAIVFLLSGVLGLVVLTEARIKNPLFPLLSGLFGVASLLLSYQSKEKIPIQNKSVEKIQGKNTAKVLATGIATGAVCSVLPGLGPSQAAILGTQWSNKWSGKDFLMLNGCLNVVNILVSFVALYTINKARNGAVASITEIIESITMQDLGIFLAVSLIGGGIGAWATIRLTKISMNIINKVNYPKMCVRVMGGIILLTLTLSGLYGLLILGVATAIGLIAPLKGIGRNHAMGCLLLPVMLFFLL